MTKKISFKDILKILGVYLIIYLICTLIFIGLFHTHNKYFDCLLRDCAFVFSNC